MLIILVKASKCENPIQLLLGCNFLLPPEREKNWDETLSVYSKHVDDLSYLPQPGYETSKVPNMLRIFK